MLKKTICAGFIVVLVFAFGVSARADGAAGEICCWLYFGENAVAEGSLEICRAGDPVPEGYRLGEEFGGGIIAGEDIPSAAFAKWMSEKAGRGLVQKPNRNGMVRFRDLEPGLYLIRQSEEAKNYYPIEPYLACVSEEMLLIDTYPELQPRSSIPRTAQFPQVYLGTLGIVLALTGIFICAEAEKRKNL